MIFNHTSYRERVRGETSVSPLGRVFQTVEVCGREMVIDDDFILCHGFSAQREG